LGKRCVAQEILTTRALCCRSPDFAGELSKMMRWMLVLVMSFVLAGCGNTRSTEFAINRSPKDVYTALSQSSVGDIAMILPELRVVRTSPAELEILYTIPKSADSEEAKVHFLLKPMNGGKATNVIATLDIPAVKTKVKGVVKVLSADKIARELRKVLNHYAIKGDSSAAQRELSSLLGGVALATNSKLAQKAFDGTLQQQALGDLQGQIGADLAAALAEADLEAGDSGDWGNSGPGEAEVNAKENDWGNGKFEEADLPEEVDAQQAAADAASAAEEAAAAASEAAERSDWAN